jgi:hypothetical protein
MNIISTAILADLVGTATLHERLISALDLPISRSSGVLGQKTVVKSKRVRRHQTHKCFPILRCHTDIALVPQLLISDCMRAFSMNLTMKRFSK